MKKELGKYVLDVSKYIVTTIILSALISGQGMNYRHVIGSIAAISALLVGLKLLK